MSAEKLLSAGYFLDLIVKAGLAGCVAVATYHFRDINLKIATLETQDAAKGIRVAVLESITQESEKHLDRIESKLDRILEIAKKVQ